MTNSAIREEGLRVYKENFKKFFVAEIILELIDFLIGAIILCASAVVFKIPKSSVLTLARSLIFYGNMALRDLTTNILDISDISIIAVVFMFIFFVLMSLLFIPAKVGIYRMSLKAHKGEEFGVSTLFECYKENPVNIVVTLIGSGLLLGLVTLFIFGLILILGMILAAIAGILGSVSMFILYLAFLVACVILMYCYRFIFVLLAEDPDIVKGEAIDIAYTFCRNNIKRIIPFFLPFIGWIIVINIVSSVVGVFAPVQNILSTIGMLLLTPYVINSTVKFYLALRN